MAGSGNFGWAVAEEKKTAEQQALAMCKAKLPPDWDDKCKVVNSGCDGSAN
jgi:hypothetical protein